MSEEKKKKVGALWVKEYTKDGETKKLLSGTVDLGVLGDSNIAVFPVESKEKETHPDYRVVYNNNGNGDSEPKQKNAGALWAKTYGENNEKKMLSGILEIGIAGNASVALFPNDRKEKDSHPDYLMYISTGKKDTDSGSSDSPRKPF